MARWRRHPARSTRPGEIDQSPAVSISDARRASGTLSGGGVSERPKEHASKACEGSRPPWVQIPPPPPTTTPPAACDRGRCRWRWQGGAGSRCRVPRRRSGDRDGGVPPARGDAVRGRPWRWRGRRPPRCDVPLHGRPARAVGDAQGVSERDHAGDDQGRSRWPTKGSTGAPRDGHRARMTPGAPAPAPVRRGRGHGCSSLRARARRAAAASWTAAMTTTSEVRDCSYSQPASSPPPTAVTPWIAANTP